MLLDYSPFIHVILKAVDALLLATIACLFLYLLDQ